MFLVLQVKVRLPLYLRLVAWQINSVETSELGNPPVTSKSLNIHFRREKANVNRLERFTELVKKDLFQRSSYNKIKSNTTKETLSKKYNTRTNWDHTVCKIKDPVFKFYSPGQNIWYKVKKSSKIGQDFKNLLPNFACFLTAIVKV